MSRVLALGLIILLVLLSLPLLVSMEGMEPCPACPATGLLGAWGMCLAVIFLLALSLPATTTALRRRLATPRPLLLVSGIERPPKSI